MTEKYTVKHIRVFFFFCSLTTTVNELAVSVTTGTIPSLTTTHRVHFLKLSLLLALCFSAPGRVAQASRKESFTVGRETHREGMCLQLHTKTSLIL